jgi:hypothetical protein
MHTGIRASEIHSYRSARSFITSTQLYETFLVATGFGVHVLLTVKWCLDNGISSQVTTPVSAADLASALISALESNTGGPVSAQKNVLYDILLAEDNLVNQKLAVKILERYGHTVEIAENGILAVEAFKMRVAQGQPFDIILVSFAIEPLEDELF